MDREQFFKGDNAAIFRAMLINLEHNNLGKKEMVLPANGDVEYDLLATSYAMPEGKAWVHVRPADTDAAGTDGETLTVYTFGGE
jgi:hypothetical protein